MVNFFCDYGTSGGAVVDREGKVVGLMSKSSTGKQVAYIEPVGPLVRAIALHSFMGRNRVHFVGGCEYCRCLVTNGRK